MGKVTKMECGCAACLKLLEPNTALHVCVEVGCYKTAMLGSIYVGSENVAKICGDCFSYYQALRRRW